MQSATIPWISVLDSLNPLAVLRHSRSGEKEYLGNHDSISSMDMLSSKIVLTE